MKCFHVSAIGKDERKKSKFYILRFCKILEFFFEKTWTKPHTTNQLYNSYIEFTTLSPRKQVPWVPTTYVDTGT